MRKRLIITTITGSILGVFCIIGAQSRFGGDLSNLYLFSFWFNRLLMGVFIGCIPFNKNLLITLSRGLIVGLFISFAFYSATEFYDLTGFIAGGVYGVIIEFAAFKFTRVKENV